MNDIPVNERIEPIRRVDALHLHNKMPSGAVIKSKKDPGAAINPGSNNYYNFSPANMFAPFLNVILGAPPPTPTLSPPGPIIPGPGEGIPSGPATPGAFVFFNGAWWASVGLGGDTYWFQFTAPFPEADPGGGNIWLSAT